MFHKTGKMHENSTPKRVKYEKNIHKNICKRKIKRI